MGFFFISCVIAYGQYKTYSDSLEAVYASSIHSDHDKLRILKALAINHQDTERKLFFSEELIRIAQALDSAEYLFQGFLEKGNALRLKGDLTHALDSYFQGAKIAEERMQGDRLGVLNTAIADVYSIMGNHQNAVQYYQKAINMLREAGDYFNMANALLNLGDEFINVSQLDSALIYTEEAESIFKEHKSQIGEAYSLGNLGMIFAKMGNDVRAEQNMSEAIQLLEALNEFYPIAVYLTYIADIYLEKGDQKKSLNYAFKSLELARRYGLKEQVSNANLKLAEIYEKAGKYKESYAYYKEYIAYKDSVSNITSVQQMADLRTDFEVSKKQIEVDLLEQQKRNQQIIGFATVVALFLISLLAFGLYRRYLFIQKTTKIIEQERERSENLLLNILPRETAQELKESGKVQARKFESVTVLFADFKAFTQYAENLSPVNLVENVDYYFSGFDRIMEAYGLEKIKTIGDAYMCAGGLPFPSNDHASKMVRAAIEMAGFVQETKKSNLISDPIEVRIGINTGPVVAGVVGTKKFAYDIWGDTVNVAARMESACEPGKINISENTYVLIKDSFDCEYRGEVVAKNKGVMKMYYVSNSKT